MNDKKKSFEKLVEEQAGCLEFAWNGFIRIYEEGEKKCECKDCKAIEKLKSDFDAIYTRDKNELYESCIEVVPNNIENKEVAKQLNQLIRHKDSMGFKFNDKFWCSKEWKDDEE
mgnify:CR=1 FL=1